MIDITREKPVSLDDVARRLGVCVHTVRNWSRRQDRRLETARAGRRVITSLEAVNRFLRQSGGGDTETDYEEAKRRLLEEHGINLERMNDETATQRKASSKAG